MCFIWNAAAWGVVFAGQLPPGGPVLVPTLHWCHSSWEMALVAAPRSCEERVISDCPAVPCRLRANRKLALGKAGRSDQTFIEHLQCTFQAVFDSDGSCHLLSPCLQSARSGTESFS